MREECDHHSLGMTFDLDLVDGLRVLSLRAECKLCGTPLRFSLPDEQLDAHRLVVQVATREEFQKGLDS